MKVADNHKPLGFGRLALHHVPDTCAAECSFPFEVHLSLGGLPAGVIRGNVSVAWKGGAQLDPSQEAPQQESTPSHVRAGAHVKLSELALHRFTLWPDEVVRWHYNSASVLSPICAVLTNQRVMYVTNQRAMYGKQRKLNVPLQCILQVVCLCLERERERELRESYESYESYERATRATRARRATREKIRQRDASCCHYEGHAALEGSL
jgi:hypothetical protein